MPTASTSCGADDAITGSNSAEGAHPSASPSQLDVLNVVLLRATRAVMQHPEVDTLYSEADRQANRARLYKILADFFTDAHTRQKRAVAIQLTKADLLTVVTLCAGHSLTAVYMTSSTNSLSSATTPTAFISRAPLLPLESVRTRFTQHGRFFLGPALAQVLQLSQRLDAVLGLHTPLGAINATHLVALACALYPTKTLADLARFSASLFLVEWPALVASGPLPDVSVVWLAVHMLEAVWTEWGLLDKAQERCWQELAKRLDAANLLHGDSSVPPDHLEVVYQKVQETIECDAFLQLSLSRGPDQAVSLDPSLPSRRSSVEQKPQSLHSPTPVGAASHDLDVDEESEEEIGAMDTRFWRDLAS